VFTAKKRVAPIRLQSDLRRDSIRIKLPAGFKLDELPAPAKIDSPYGTLDAKWTATGEEIQMDEPCNFATPPCQRAGLF